LQLLQERIIQAGQALLPVQVLKGESKSQVELVRTGVHLEIQRAAKKRAGEPIIAIALIELAKKNLFREQTTGVFRPSI
jgi:hypothetical protein